MTQGPLKPQDLTSLRCGFSLLFLPSLTSHNSPTWNQENVSGQSQQMKAFTSPSMWDPTVKNSPPSPLFSCPLHLLQDLFQLNPYSTSAL